MRALFLAAWLAAPGAAQPPLPAPAARPLSLTEAYALALERSEELAQRGEAVAELEASVDELWGGVRPKVSLVGSEQVQDVPSGVSGVSTTFSQRTREQAQLTLHQPLFSGLREYLAARSGKARLASAELALARAQQLLYQDVARGYLDVLGARRELDIRKALIAITDEQIRDLKEREKLGRSRRSEVLAAESQKAQALAALETARGAEAVAQVRLRFLTGAEEDLAPEPVALPSPVLEPALEALARRPDVEAARRERDAAALDVGVASRQRWPVLALDGNYYLRRPPGFNDKIKWDAVFSLTLPLYDGGTIGAQTRRSKARERSAEAALSLARRKAELEESSARRDLSSALAAVAALEEAGRAAEANARAQREDFRLGQVTNLDVLGSLNVLQETRLRLDAARLLAYWARVRLDVAAGSVR